MFMVICRNKVEGGVCGGIIEDGGKQCVCASCGRVYKSRYSRLLAKRRQEDKIEGVVTETVETAEKNMSYKVDENIDEVPVLEGTGVMDEGLTFEGGVSTDDIEDLEDLVFPVVYEIVPESRLAEEKQIETKLPWDETKDKFGHDINDITKLLDDEARRLVRHKFRLSGINFNALGEDEATALMRVRKQSELHLQVQGKTYTKLETEKEEKRKAEAKAKEAASRANDSALSAAQGEELVTLGVIRRAALKKLLPTAETVLNRVSAARLKAELEKYRTTFTLETVAAYVKFWKDICGTMRNGEFGLNSYWIATGDDWYLEDFKSDVLKTAYATGLSVTPPVLLDQLRAIFDRSHDYLNDLEFLSRSPRNIRDGLERFKVFNEAYRAVNEGGTGMVSQYVRAPYTFSWRAYMESDVVIIQLPNTGLVIGGAAVLMELLSARNALGLATILISTRSVKEMNALNAGFIPEFFDKSRATLISAADAARREDLHTHNFVYFSVWGDDAERESSSKNEKARLEARQNRRG
jgi:hypothetical protein